MREDAGFPAAGYPVLPDRGHPGGVQRADGQALERHLQGDEGLCVRLLWQGAGQHGQGNRGEGGRRCRDLGSEDRPRHAGDHHLRRVRRRDWRFGPKRGGRAHVRPVPQRGPHLFEQAPGIRESRFHAGAGVQRHQGGRLRGHQSDSRAGSRCRGERRRRDRRRGRGHAHRCPHARPGRAGRCRARRSAGPGGLPLPPCPRRPPRSRRAIGPATWKPVVAPMVGTYYEAPAPASRPS